MILGDWSSDVCSSDLTPTLDSRLMLAPPTLRPFTSAFPYTPALSFPMALNPVDPRTLIREHLIQGSPSSGSVTLWPWRSPGSCCERGCSSGTDIPQRPYKPPKSPEEVRFGGSILFLTQTRCGIPVTDALGGNCRKLLGRDDCEMFPAAGASISLRFEVSDF